MACTTTRCTQERVLVHPCLLSRQIGLRGVHLLNQPSRARAFPALSLPPFSGMAAPAGPDASAGGTKLVKQSVDAGFDWVFILDIECDLTDPKPAYFRFEDVPFRGVWGCEISKGELTATRRT